MFDCTYARRTRREIMFRPPADRAFDDEATAIDVREALAGAERANAQHDAVHRFLEIDEVLFDIEPGPVASCFLGLCAVP